MGVTERGGMDPKIDKLVRITTLVSTCTVAYFLLTADYGPEYNVLKPVIFPPFSLNPSIHPCADEMVNSFIIIIFSSTMGYHIC